MKNKCETHISFLAQTKPGFYQRDICVESGEGEAWRQETPPTYHFPLICTHSYISQAFRLLLIPTTCACPS